ncbi:hypothetical protein COS81_04260 [candidate division WWE3 bacterium CG06_land_8_20_14_3_00_42_16]|uniref:Glycogen synthase n=2 Tax=Katanobacteria TaxID=422282 RepID=A0A2M7ALR9_UNCKA|nr:MAG: hypothetical protein COS81_04260 [candidate division WWE3 bacterium CG06_land_8_20_14_3_00_42_16]PJA37460.1 MAG: hypothetical protein CO181_03500 [candidate division WWE3 bacterium CG_4_9_14_3_um_filter_43_9]
MTKNILAKVVSGIVTPLASPKNPLNILIVGTEASPYAQVGGIGRVLFFLPQALMRLGHDVRVMIPKYGKIDEKKYPLELVYEGLKIPTGEKGSNEYLICNVKTHKLPEGPRVYFLENMEYYEKRANEYGYVDDPIRFAILCRGVLEFIRHYEEWKPQIIHCNDWQSALIPQYLKTVYKNRLKDITVLYTIHNLYYQGMFDHHFVSELDFDDGKSQIPSFFSERIHKINPMRRGIIYADLINTVSPTYAQEILTSEYGEGLDSLLRELRTKLSGILNGIDYTEFNPATDKIIHKNYTSSSIELREENKRELQREFNLPIDPETMIFGISSRLEDQKGIDLFMGVIEYVLKEYKAQLIVNGGGEGKYLSFFQKLEKDFPGKVGTNLNFDYTLPRHIFAGADVFLMPSRFEPCGITQMEAMRYGAIPLVRATGGLADTVEDFNPTNNTGTGFVFKTFDKMAFFGTLVRAMETYKYKAVWKNLIKRAMKKDFSWVESAKRYSDLYYRAIDLYRQKKIARTHIQNQEEG